MAVMYPPRLPEGMDADPGRRAEAAVYRALSRLSSSFHVFYSVKWQGRDSAGAMRDGEADFVVAHPELGLLCIEVKAGTIEYRGHAERWYRIKDDGTPKPLRPDPVDQARDSHHTLLGCFQSLPRWVDDRWLTIGHALAFPDVRVPAGPLPPEINRAIIFDAPALDTIEDTVRRAFDHYAHDARDGALGDDRLARVIELLDGWVVMPVVDPQTSLAAIEERLIALSRDQIRLLDLLCHYPRVLVRGCAGSGKTLLAVEKARRLAREGRRVLLTCFNRPLGEHLAGVVAEGVVATNFHDLCYRVAREAGVPCEPETSPPPREYFDETLPMALLAAAQRLDRRFDALIIDEAQDFKDIHWLALSELLAGDESLVYIFYDTNQDLYRGALAAARARFKLFVDAPPYELNHNCRNTQAIHRVASEFHQGEPEPVCDGPEGPPVEVIRCGGKREQQKAVRRLLHQLIVDEGIDPADVAVLCGHALDADSPFAPGTALGNFTLTADDPPGPGQVHVDSILRFKGLDRAAVILADLDDEGYPDLPSQLYVGCTRARARLAVVVDANADAAVLARLERAASGLEAQAAE